MHFVLPLQREDLLRRPAEDNIFWLSQGLLSPRELLTRLKQVDLALKQAGSAFVDDGNGGFEVLFSAVLSKEGISSESKSGTLDILQRALETLEQELDRVLANGK